MTRFFIKRFLGLLFVLWGISTLVFFFQQAIPGSPADLVLGVDASDIDKAQWLHEAGLDKPILARYWFFLKDTLHGHLGYTYSNHVAVFDVIQPRMTETARLACVAFVVSVLLSFVMGWICVWFQNSWIDKGLSTLSLCAISTPGFVTAPLLLWFFSVKIHLFPLMGNVGWRAFILPAITLGAPLAGFSCRMFRASMLDTLSEPFIRTAYSKGLSKRQVLFRHGARVALLPVLTILGVQLGVLLGGTVITEQIFGWPGLGNLIIEAVQQREYNIVSGCVLVTATFYVLCNMCVDFLYQVLDPRVSLED